MTRPFSVNKLIEFTEGTNSTAAYYPEENNLLSIEESLPIFLQLWQNRANNVIFNTWLLK